MIPLRDSLRSRTIPIFSYSLILANAWAFSMELRQGSRIGEFLLLHGLVPARWAAAWPQPQAWEGLLASLFSSMFLHGGWMHLLSNLWCLYIFADNVEDRMGHWSFLALYLASGAAAGLLQVAVHWGSRVPTIGASGAIAGVMGAYFLLFPRARVVTFVPLFLLPWLVEVPAFVYLGFWFLLQLYSGAFLSGGAYGGVAWWAHVGGFAAGMYLVRRLQRRRRLFF